MLEKQLRTLSNGLNNATLPLPALYAIVMAVAHLGAKVMNRMMGEHKSEIKGIKVSGLNI